MPFETVERGPALRRADAPNLAFNSRHERRRNELIRSKREIAKLSARIAELSKEREELLRKLSHLYDERFGLRNSITETLNQRLAPTIRVRFEQSGDRSAFRDFLESALRQFSSRPGPLATQVSKVIAPDQLAALIRRGEPAEIMARCELTEKNARSLLSACSAPEELYGLELIRFDDAPSIELLDKGVYRPSVALSTGQKCTTILPILLYENLYPVLIDQPEDNLDNTYIFDMSAKMLRNAKALRQMIFATLNPNLVVLGGADHVIVFGSHEGHAVILIQGTVQECKAFIIKILEGGAEAFEERMRTYGY